MVSRSDVESLVRSKGANKKCSKCGRVVGEGETVQIFVQANKEEPYRKSTRCKDCPDYPRGSWDSGAIVEGSVEGEKPDGYDVSNVSITEFKFQ